MFKKVKRTRAFVCLLVMFAVLLTQALSGVFDRLPDAGLTRRLQAHRRRKDRSRTETALPEEGGAADA